MILSFIFIFLAAICNSIMDITNHHFSDSIFSKLNHTWWNGEISWKNKYINREYKWGRRKLFNTKINFPVQLTDAFHFFKTLMIVFICLSIITFDKCHFYKYCNITAINYLMGLIIYGTLWNLTFSLFYNSLLKK